MPKPKLMARVRSLTPALNHTNRNTPIAATVYTRRIPPSLPRCQARDEKKIHRAGASMPNETYVDWGLSGSVCLSFVRTHPSAHTVTRRLRFQRSNGTKGNADDLTAAVRRALPLSLLAGWLTWHLLLACLLVCRTIMRIGMCVGRRGEGVGGIERG